MDKQWLRAFLLSGQQDSTLLLAIPLSLIVSNESVIHLPLSKKLIF